MKKLLFATTAIAALTAGRKLSAFATTNSGGKLYISVDGSNNPVAANSDLTQTAYEALTWLEVSNIGNIGETGSNTNVATYDTWDKNVAQKAAGVTNAGDPEIELARVPTDLGQIAMRTAAQSANRTNNYAFKIERLTGEINYNRGLCLGPRHPNGRNEDFNLEIFVIACNQEEITVEPS